VEWYEVDDFKDRLAQIEQFFIEIAANEERLSIFGLKRALVLPSAAPALEALKTFTEDFSALRQYILRVDRVLAQELEQLDSEGRLVEQVSLIALRLRMVEARKPVNAGIATVNRIFNYLPYSWRGKGKGLFGEEPVSLHKTIINLARLRGIAGIFYEYLSNRTISDDEVFKPSNVKPERVVDLIDQALTEIGTLSSISPKDLERIQGYLLEAKKEALSTRPSWSKIIGALVIVAAITSGLADAPAAAKNVKEAIEYILGSSITKPLQKFLPPPEEKTIPEPPGRNVD